MILDPPQKKNSRRKKVKRTSRRWTDEEIKLIENNRSPIGRTFYGVRNKKTQLGLRQKRQYRPKWSEENLQLLQSCRKDGKKIEEICKLLPGHSKNAIQKRLCRLGVVKKNKIFKFPIEIRERFRNFLRSNWQGKTPEDLTILWNKENSKFITNKRRVISYLSEMKIKISYGEVQKINNLRKREQKAISIPTKSPVDRLERLRLERVRLMRERIEKQHDIWTGLKTGLKTLEMDE